MELFWLPSETGFWDTRKAHEKWYVSLFGVVNTWKNHIFIPF